jgi:hypothetical protein
MSTDSGQVAVDSHGAAPLIGVGVETLKRWRRTGHGPTYIRVANNRVRYRLADIAAWMDAHAVTPGSTGAQPDQNNP